MQGGYGEDEKYTITQYYTLLVRKPKGRDHLVK
jgi:hypothetical protein